MERDCDRRRTVGRWRSPGRARDPQRDGRLERDGGRREQARDPDSGWQVDELQHGRSRHWRPSAGAGTPDARLCRRNQGEADDRTDPRRVPRRRCDARIEARDRLSIRHRRVQLLRPRRERGERPARGRPGQGRHGPDVSHRRTGRGPRPGAGRADHRAQRRGAVAHRREAHRGGPRARLADVEPGRVPDDPPHRGAAGHRCRRDPLRPIREPRSRVRGTDTGRQGGRVDDRGRGPRGRRRPLHHAERRIRRSSARS